MNFISFTLLFAVFSTSASAALSDCKNPTTIPLEGNIKMRFCTIPSKNGVSIGSETGHPNERPVKLRNFKSFQIGQYHVTREQFKSLLAESPWSRQPTDETNEPESPKNDHLAAAFVSLGEVKLFAKILGILDKSATYRLPTEAEWEYAARGGSTTAYFWGENYDPDYAYSFDNTKGLPAPDVYSCPNKTRDSQEKGYCANKFGLMNMVGMLYQWTLDIYDGDLTNAPIDGNTPGIKLRDCNLCGLPVLRGGYFQNFHVYTRSSLRLTPNIRIGDPLGGESGRFYTGFRIVRIPKPKKPIR